MNETILNHAVQCYGQKTAVFKILKGHNRQEQTAFKAFRSYYLFKSNYCTLGQGHEKGGVENDAGYVPRNFLTPLLQVNSYEELNALLRKVCLADVHRHVRGKEAPVAEPWEDEKPQFLPLPPKDYPACVTYPVRPNAYSRAVGCVLDTPVLKINRRYSGIQRLYMMTANDGLRTHPTTHDMRQIG